MFKNLETKTIFEPFRIKMVESLPLISPEERQVEIQKARFNLFLLPAEKVTFDFLTDSGTSAMSAEQWAAMLRGDESYAGSKSYFHFQEVVQDLTGLNYVVPTHQGRSAEALLAKAVLKPDMMVPGNTHFDTTRANIEASGAQAVDLPCLQNKNSAEEFPFKGNIDVEALARRLETDSKRIPFVIMTVTNNSVGGQPVSLENIEQTASLLKKYNIPFFIDAARFAENSYFIKIRESQYRNWSVKKIAQKVFSFADGVLMSAKKDAFGNIGGFLALRDQGLAEKVRALMVITEGFPTYGGLAGRDLEALAVGLREVVDEDYLTYRIRSTEYFGHGVEAAGFKVVKPFGGHAVYIDAAETLSHIPPLQYPGQSLSVALYEAIGLRSVEVGSVMLGRRDEKTGEEHAAPKELVRLAIPRRVYTQSHIDYIIECLQGMAKNITCLSGYRITKQDRFLRHFTAEFEKV